MVAPTAIGDNLNAGQGKGDVGRSGREQLFTCLCGQHRVVEGQGCVAQRAGALPCDLPDLWRKAMIFHLTRTLPALEISGLPAQAWETDFQLPELVELKLRKEVDLQCYFESHGLTSMLAHEAKLSRSLSDPKGIMFVTQQSN